MFPNGQQKCESQWRKCTVPIIFRNFGPGGLMAWNSYTRKTMEIFVEMNWLISERKHWLFTVPRIQWSYPNMFRSWERPSNRPSNFQIIYYLHLVSLLLLTHIAHLLTHTFLFIPKQILWISKRETQHSLEVCGRVQQSCERFHSPGISGNLCSYQRVEMVVVCLVWYAIKRCVLFYFENKVNDEFIIFLCSIQFGNFIFVFFWLKVY